MTPAEITKLLDRLHELHGELIGIQTDVAAARERMRSLLVEIEFIDLVVALA